MPDYLPKDNYFIEQTSSKDSAPFTATSKHKSTTEKVVTEFKKALHESPYKRSTARSRVVGYVKK